MRFARLFLTSLTQSPAMRVLSDGDWICHNIWPPQHGLQLALKVMGDRREVLLDVIEDDLMWPDEGRELYASDVFTLIGIGQRKQSLFDLFYSESAQNAEPQFAEQFDQVHFGKVYTLFERACARCNMCKARCTRSGDHSLCSHGSFTHLWSRPQHHCGNNKKTNHRVLVAVEGYMNGCGLRSRFSIDELNTELPRIQQQYGITLPREFCVLDTTLDTTLDPEYVKGSLVQASRPT